MNRGQGWPRALQTSHATTRASNQSKCRQLSVNNCLADVASHPLGTVTRITIGNACFLGASLTWTSENTLGDCFLGVLGGEVGIFCVSRMKKRCGFDLEVAQLSKPIRETVFTLPGLGRRI